MTTPHRDDPRVLAGDKWIRGLLGGTVVVDSRRYQMAFENPHWPSWFFPRDHIDADVVRAADQTGMSDGVVRYDLVADGQTLPGAARGYREHPELRDFVSLEFDALDHWFEEDVEVFVHPRSPYNRIDALASSRHVVVSLDGVELADSRKPTVLFETTAPARFYLPMTDTRLDLLIENDRRTSCPYKGDAKFFDARIGDGIVPDVAWTYALCRPESAPIAGLISFYNERVDIDIDGERQLRPETRFA